MAFGPYNGLSTGDGGGGGGGGLHFRNPADDFAAADLTACRAARDTYFSAAANAAALSEFQGDQSLAIVLDPANSADNTFETYLPATAGTTYDDTQWVARTDAVQGNPGDDGSQGRFELIIHSNSASSTRSAPTGGSYDTATGAFTPPPGWTEAPTTPGTGEDVYASQAVIDPETQSGTVIPVWSTPVERSHLSAGISHVETSADFTGAGTAIDVLALANPLVPNPSSAPTEALLAIKYGGTTYNVDEVIDVTDTGLPVLSEANHRSLFIDFDTPRVWIGHRVHNARVDALGTFADYMGSGYQGALSSGPATTVVGQSYYDTSRHAWYSAPVGGIRNVWRQTALPTLITGAQWLGELLDDVTAANSINVYSSSDTYLYYNTTTGTIRVLDNSTYGAPQDPTISYQVEPISAPGGIVSAITGLTAGAGLAGGGTSGVVSVAVDVTAADFPTVPIDKGGTGATDAAAARVALGLSAGGGGGGGGAVDLGNVTVSSDRLTVAAPSGYSRYPRGTLLLFKVFGVAALPSSSDPVQFYIGTDRYDLYGPSTSSIYFTDLEADTYYLAIVDSAVQILGPVSVPADLQIGYKAFTNPPSNLTDTEKTAVRTAVDSAAIADVLAQILAGTGISIDTTVDGQITLASTVAGGSADGTLQTVVLDVAAQEIKFTSTSGVPIVLDISALATDTDLSAYAPLASPVLTGTPTAPLAVKGTNNKQIATTAYVTTAVAAAALTAGADGVLSSAALQSDMVTLRLTLSNSSNIEADLSDLISGLAALGGATFTGATGGIAPVAASDFVTKSYADANYGGGAAPTAHDLYAGWSADTAISDSEILGGGVSDTNSVVMPMATGSQYMFVWRADADGGDPSEVHIAGAGNSRTLFGTAAARAVDGLAGQLIVSVNNFNATAISGSTIRVV